MTQAANLAGTGICKAWVKFQGGNSNTAGVILASFNVSSITVSSTGRYRVNLTNSMSAADYAIVASSSFANGVAGNLFANNDSDTIPTASIFGVATFNSNTGAYANATYVYAAAFAS